MSLPNVIHYKKGNETFTFIFTWSNREELLRVFGRHASSQDMTSAGMTRQNYRKWYEK